MQQPALLSRLVYFLILTPAGLVSRLAADPLRRRAPERSNWIVAGSTLPPDDARLRQRW
jgi:hypothetical protein